MSSLNPEWALALPPAAPPLTEESLVASAKRGYRALRQRWLCQGPECAEREGLRSWVKLPARVQLQEGWCCGPECLEASLNEIASRELRRIQLAPDPHTHRVPLGLTLLSQGLINAGQLRAALQAQQRSPEARRHRIGEWLMREGAASEDDVAAGVALQWARPRFRLDHSQGWRQCRGWVPLPVLTALRMLPLHFSAGSSAGTRKLFVGFTQGIDFNATMALGKIFDCRIETCIVTDSALDSVFDEMRATPARGLAEDIGFDHVANGAEVARIARQYAQVVQARQVRLAGLGPFLWIRLRGQRIVHLTFRVSA